eukprot:CAMPEP_0119404688 /NCGR_PEP_ID=MMETSP1334-20130426/144022_1 /TAXON_ID=127549 /ORGANISM="Calcidiscus leptoporus, Strain RCC1130" /LENGTH=146 /DNA_ID=CAMNT_0007428659 /DNA_START=276 /DNA_END=714 /DNA_ORIENTATION=-
MAVAVVYATSCRAGGGTSLSVKNRLAHGRSGRVRPLPAEQVAAHLALERLLDGREAPHRVRRPSVVAIPRPLAGGIWVWVGQLEDVDLLLPAAQEETGEWQLDRPQVSLVTHAQHVAVEGFSDRRARDEQAHVRDAAPSEARARSG